MSLESAKAYLKKVKEDEAFRKKVSEAENDEDRMKIVGKAGFKFTKAEIRQAVQEQTGKKLSEKDLENVAGGAIVGGIFGVIGTIAATTGGTVAANKAGGGQQQ